MAEFIASGWVDGRFLVGLKFRSGDPPPVESSSHACLRFGQRFTRKSRHNGTATYVSPSMADDIDRVSVEIGGSMRLQAPLTPEPPSKLQNAQPPSHGAGRSGKPGQLASRTAAGLGGASPNAAQTRLFDPLPDALTTSMGHWRPIFIKRISIGQASRAQASRSMGRTHDLPVGQGAPDQYGSCFVAKILRFVRPMRDEGAQIQPRRQHVFVEVEHWETVRRIPPPASTARETGVEGVLPGRVGDAPPFPAVGKCFPQEFHAQPWACSNANISRHAAKTPRVSPAASNSSRETPSRAGIGRRTAAGILSRLR